MTDPRRRKTVRLTTRGRKSGQPRTVSLWFVIQGPRTVRVQHASPAPAQWYRNLVADPHVTLDFGDGPIAALARPLTDAEDVQNVLAAIRRRYWTARLIQWLGRRATPIAAEISW
ncbi:nitroreductase family deazaflavin-dependent oxidoreductase [bacterium]|nr:nitroreductase family deazaflavin-dependent oxidoreductase [bacterium]